MAEENFEAVQGAVVLNAPVEIIPENGKFIVRVKGKYDNVDMIMGSGYSPNELAEMKYFAERVYKLGFSDSALQVMNVKEEKKCFGVIATSTLMFLKWKKEQGHETGPSAARKYSYNGDMYVCLIKPEHCCGYTFDELIEIYDAYNNPDYERIKEMCKPTMKPKK
jgi:hypothetical protein